MMTTEKTSRLKLLMLSAVLYAGFLAYLAWYLGFDMFVSDVHLCWPESLRWRTPWNTFWAPGYPLLLAALRAITVNKLQPLHLMWSVSFGAHLVSVYTVYRFAAYEKFTHPFQLAVLFAIFPFVGLSRSVYPTSDISSIALMLLAMYAYRKEKWVHFAVFAGGAMFFQKILWFFVPPLAAAAFVQHKQSRAWIPLAFVPIIVWAVSGAFFYHDPVWFLRTKLLTSTSSLPFFDGLITPFFAGSLPKFSKGVFIGSIFISVIYGIYYSVSYKLWLPFCTCLSLAIMCVLINSFEIWAVARYSKLLVVPFCMIVHYGGIDRFRVPRLLSTAIVAACLLTNLAAEYYMSPIIPAS